MGKNQAAKLKKQDNITAKANKKAKSESIVVPAGTTETESNDVVDVVDNALTLDVTVSRETLEGTPVRMLTLLKAIGTSTSIRAAMATRGYNREHHLEGWRLLHAVSGFHETTLPAEDTSVRDAIKQLDDWDEGGFQIITASLRYRFPDQAAFLLTGLQASTGAAAVLGVKQLLDRLDALESASERESTRQQDQAAIALLAQRGIDASERQRLRDLIAIAESAPELSLPNAQAVAQAESVYLKGLMALRVWFVEWAGIAHVAIKRRDYLIRMGLAKRRPHVAQPANPATPAPEPGAG